MRIQGIGDAREQQTRQPDGAPPLSIEIACVAGALVAGAVIALLRAWLAA